MTLRPNKPTIKLPVLSPKKKSSHSGSMLDMKIQVKVVNDNIVLNIQLDQIHLIGLFKYFLEKSLMNHFRFVCPENEIPGDELSKVKEERVSIYRIDRKSALSEREVEVLEELAIGSTNKEIGEHFKITANTVRCHLQSAYLKLGVRNRLAAVTEYRRLFENVNKLSSGK